MIYLTGYTSDTAYLAEIKRLGWGRMLCEQIGGPSYPEEPLGIDNGAFGAWNNGLLWDGREYLAKMAKAAAVCPSPYLAVVPDKVADPDSLRFSMRWLERVAGRWQWPWYLAVQDGMTPETVAPVLPHFAGLFLGGTKTWKQQTARQWVKLAHEHDRRAHYARCSTAADLAHARRCGYDSADSTFLLWTRTRFRQFVAEFEGLNGQGGLAL